MLVLALLRAALAHARLAESVPADGAVLDVAPSTVTLRFDSAVEAALGRFTLEGAAPVALARREDPDPRVIVVALPPIGAGAHRVTWRVVSRDGHPITGELRFTVE